MKITNKILLLVLILVVALSFGVLNKSYADENDTDDYIDLNNVEPDDETNTTTETENKEESKEESKEENNTTETQQNTTNQTNTTENVANVTKTNTENNTANPTNQATENHPQTGDFVDGKIIAGVSIAAIALVVAFAKLKKYSY